MPRYILLVGEGTQRLQALELLSRAPHLSVTAAQGCVQAIAELERRVPDVLVADMDVLADDGISLLLTVAQRWPSISRIALADSPDYPGQSYQTSAPVAHQYIGWDTAQVDLREAIERCLKLQDLLSNPGLRSLIGSIRHLPPRPRIFTRLQVMLSHKNVTPKKICAVVEADAAITAKVMQLANCALFHGERVRNIEQALVRLGFLGVRNLVLSSEVLTGWSRKAGSALDLDSMQAHVQRVARVVAALTVGTPYRDEVVLAAFLHDIGYWVLAQERPQELDRACALAVAEDIPVHEAERRVLGTCHAEIGAYLLGLWGMPNSLVEAIAYHHKPERAGVLRFNTLSALAAALALSGTDDSDAFAGPPRRNGVVGQDFFDRLDGCPFDWVAAEKIAMDCLAEQDP
jgi:HD-like signal output (HDOD) protein/CheY-like chemotaxis protein